MTVFREVRERLRLNQSQMAERLGISRQYWQQVEAGCALLGDEAGQRLEAEVGALPLSSDCLRTRQLRDWTLTRPLELERVNQEPWQRALADWSYPIERLRLPRRLKEWMLKLFPCDSALEGYAWLQLGALGAVPLLENPHELGFRAQPIVDRLGQALGERRLPGLRGAFGSLRFLIWPQVALRPGRTTFRPDGLVWLKQGRQGTWAIVEIDGSGHDFSRDSWRGRWLRLGEIRLAESEISQGQAAPSFCRQAAELLSGSQAQQA